MDECSNIEPEPRRHRLKSKEHVRKDKYAKPRVKSEKRAAQSDDLVNESTKKLRTCKVCTEQQIVCPFERNHSFELALTMIDSLSSSER